MSENIRGITFAEQTVTPADDAIVRRAILGDGILTGCDVTYSGSTLTMAAGYIIACGRAFQVTAAQNWAVVDATSGFARLLLTLDLTKTATEDTFKQIEFSLEYAAAEDGFLDLVQEDINLSGAKYQIVAAVVSLGTGGITGIVSKLERTEGGGGLNFKVVVGLTQPGSATENTIWLKTEKMTGWVLDVRQPENLAEGMVWIKNGNESPAKFNALKKNGLQVYPLRAKQMVSGTLVDVTAMSYQGGKWVDWFTCLIKGNDLCEDTTGGWMAKELGWNSNLDIPSKPNVTKNSDSITLSLTAANWASGIYVPNKKINLKNVDKIKIDGFANAVGSGGGTVDFVLYSVIGSYSDVNVLASVAISTENKMYELPVANYNEEYVVAIRLLSTQTLAASVTIKEIQLENV